MPEIALYGAIVGVTGEHDPYALAQQAVGAITQHETSPRSSDAMRKDPPAVTSEALQLDLAPGKG